MRRRRFIAAVGLTAATTLAGCLSDSAPPPRKSKVLEQLKARNSMLRIDTADDPWVLSRDESNGDLRAPSGLGSQSLQIDPVGVAAAKGGGSGGGRGAAGRASGGYSSAPKTRHGWAWWHGGDYTDEWYEEHADAVEKYGVTIAAIGVAYLGSTDEYRDDRPGAGPVPWDQKYENPSDFIEHPIREAGWHRVGVHIVDDTNNRDFRWEAVDFEVVPDGSGFELQNVWKVSPRI
jgi:hypothetical protein